MARKLSVAFLGMILTIFATVLDMGLRWTPLQLSTSPYLVETALG